MFVNDNHPAFVYCKQGRWQELDRILSTKEVTVADVNVHGQTLLHVRPDFTVGSNVEI